VANFTAGTSFTDGVTNDVTAAKLNALVADATPTSNLALASTSGTISNFTTSTANITLGTIPTLTAGTTTGTAGVFTSGTITTGVIPTLTAGTTTSTNAVVTNGTITNLSATTSTFLGTITGSTNVVNIGSGQIYKDASGNVGIGTASVNAGSKLHIAGGGSGARGALRLSDGSLTAYWDIGRDNTTSGAFTISDTTTERLRIDSSGNVGIGITSPSAQLELSTDSAKKPSTNTWTIASDQRLKTNITNADNDRCYEIVKQVPLKRYTWKSEVYSQEKVKDRSKLGWIAQDVEAVFPKAVGTNRFSYNQVFEDVVTPELDSDGNAVLDENGVAKTKTEKRLVSEDVIEDCKDLNSDQIYAAMYGTIQKLIEKVEFLESKVATLEAA